jgi:predicted amidophosphoribosyltransferase
MKEIEFPKCTICKQNMKSNATNPNYCRLCGMTIEQKQEFCCESCRKKYRNFKIIKLRVSK